MAQLRNANVLPIDIVVNQEHIVVPDEYEKDDTIEVRHEKYLEEHVRSLNLFCGICYGVPGPRQFNTGHCGGSICTKCLDSAFLLRNNGCPLCGAYNVHKNCFGINLQGKKMIEEFRAKCSNPCGTTGTIREILEHQAKQCPLRMISCSTCNGHFRANAQEEHYRTDCKYKCRDCHQMVLISMRAQHMQDTCFKPCKYCNVDQHTHNMVEHEHVCTKRPSSCICKKVLAFDMLEHHTTTECPKTVLVCPNSCGISVQRSMMTKHSEECPNALVKCDLCPHECMRMELAAHRADKYIHWENFMKEQQVINAWLKEQLRLHCEARDQMYKSLSGDVSTIIGVINNLEKFRECTVRDVSDLKFDAEILRRVCDDVTYLMRSSYPNRLTETSILFEENAVKLDTVNHLFEAADTFQGARPGYVFKMDSLGLGYYIDRIPIRDDSVLQSTPATIEPERAVIYKYNKLDGMAVRRSRTWDHGNEDGYGVGIIKYIKNMGNIYYAAVKWENGNEFHHYRVDLVRNDLVFA
jgi:hypothetical protein